MSDYPVAYNKNGKPPYGYEPLEDGEKYFQPNDEVLDKLVETINYINMEALSIREGAIYLTYHADRPITYEGLRLIIRDERHPIYESTRGESLRGTDSLQSPEATQGVS